ncbi:MAG: glycosyltransferase family 2 protein [Nanoarchaeota archaeon]|nr:glycosyltransferase family 2 protein [Nanoarchaeota archaeon]
MDFISVFIYISSFFGLFMSLYYLLTYFEENEKTIPKKSKYLPSVTIVVPCFNEETTVVKTLESLTLLIYDKKKMQVLVIDDGSRDDTYRKAKKFAEKHKHISVYRKKNRGKFTALNFALKKTKGELFGALDADSIVDKNALRNIVKRFYDTNVMAVTPSMKVYGPENTLQKIQAIEYDIGIFLREILRRLGSIHVTPGPFSFYRTEFFKKYGGYKQAYHTEDIEVALRAQKNHLHIENAVDAIVYTVAPKDLKTLFRQRLRWYYGYLMNIFAYKDLLSFKHGNLGIIILPSTIISVVLLLFGTGLTLYTAIRLLFKKIISYAIINFDIIRLMKLEFDIFYLSVSATTIISLVLVMFSILIYVLAYRMAKSESSLISYVSFSLIYSVLFGFWWFSTLFHVIANRNIGWGHKSLK